MSQVDRKDLSFWALSSLGQPGIYTQQVDTMMTNQATPLLPAVPSISVACEQSIHLLSWDLCLLDYKNRNVTTFLTIATF